MLFSDLNQDSVDLHEPQSQRQYDQMRPKILARLESESVSKGLFRFVIQPARGPEGPAR